MQSDPVVQGFAEYLAEDGKRPKTVQSYTGDVADFLAHLRRMGADFGGEMKRFHVTSFRNRLVEAGHNASTVNKKINSLMAFNRYLVGRGLTPEAVVDLRKDRVRVAAGSERQVEVYSERQLERLLFYVRGDRASARDGAIVLTLLYTGVGSASCAASGSGTSIF